MKQQPLLIRLLALLISFLFTLDHPLMVASASFVYLLFYLISFEELLEVATNLKHSSLSLKDFASNGRSWLQSLNHLSKENDISPQQGREIVSNLYQGFDIPNESLEILATNSSLRDKVSAFIQMQIQANGYKKDEQQEDFSWLESSLNDNDEVWLSSFFKHFFAKHLPDLDLDAPYTQKQHLRLFKKLKASTRNSDGSIKDKPLNTIFEFADYSLREAFYVGRSGQSPDVYTLDHCCADLLKDYFDPEEQESAINGLYGL